MFRLFSQKWGEIGLSPDMDEDGQLLSGNHNIENRNMIIRLREGAWPGGEAVMGTFYFEADEQIRFSGLAISCVLLAVFRYSLQVRLSPGMKRDVHDHGAHLIFLSGRSFTLQFYKGREYHLVMIFYPPGFIANPEAASGQPWRVPPGHPAAWQFPRALVIEGRLLKMLSSLPQELQAGSNNDLQLRAVADEVLSEFISAKERRFQPPQLSAAQLDGFYAERDRLLGLATRISSFSKLLSLADIRDRPLFRKRLNQLYGMNIRDFILRVRMEKAVVLLEDSGLPIKQIAAMTGFKNAFYFSRVFSRYFGRPPKFFRSGPEI